MDTDKLCEIYLDWVNNFISIETYAAHYCLTTEAATLLIEAAKVEYLARYDN